MKSLKAFLHFTFQLLPHSFLCFQLLKTFLDLTDPNIFSWYFGAMSRQDATDLLMGEREGGVFLVRDSATIQVRLVPLVMVTIMVIWMIHSCCHGGDDDDDVDGVLDW